MRETRGSLITLAVLLSGCAVSFRAGAELEGSPGPSEEPPRAYAAQPAPAPAPAPVPAHAHAPAAAPAPAPPAAAPALRSPRVSGNNQRVTLQPGLYRGELSISGNNLEVHGAGAGATVIEGDLRVSGNHNRVQGLTVRGATRVTGNGNHLAGIEYQGPVSASGNKNSY